MNNDTSPSKRSTTAILLSVSFFVLTLFLFTPARIYAGNFMEFSFGFRQSMAFFLIFSLVLILMLFTAFLMLCRQQQTRRVAVSVLFVLAFLAWLQGNIILWQYGLLNGKEIEWKNLIRYGIIDSIVWTVLIAFSLLKPDLVFRVSRLGSLALITVQLLSVALAWISMPKDQSFRKQETNANSLFLFSEHVNVVVLVLDTFQSDIFRDIIQEHPDLKSSFDGFTYFRNSLAGSDGTSVSIPNMLTASNYDNSMPYLDFVKKSFLDNSLPKSLKKYGFSIDLYPILKYSVYNDLTGIASSGKKLTDWGAFFKEQAFIADLALFQSFPHFIKQLIYNRQKWFLSGLMKGHQDAENAKGTLKGRKQESAGSYKLKYSREFENSRRLVKKNWDATFINRMIPLSGTTRKTDTFKFYHLNGIHPALIMNENLEYEVMNPSRAGMKRQGTGILKIAAVFLDRLRQMKVYDNSLIFIVWDHGSGLSAVSINVSPYGANLNKSGPYKGLFENFKSAGIPLILVKRRNSKGELRISDAPVSLSDIPQTVVEELGLKAKFPGKSMFRVKESERRARIYRAFRGSQEDVQYLAPLHEYSVNGFSWDDTSWRETGKVYYPRAK